jgi:LmbE family N-acetylglucosaminyl deacetylase
MKMKNILVVAVHPDDETLGCGGTLLRLKKEGFNIHWLIITAIYCKKYDQIFTVDSKGKNRPLSKDFIHFFQVGYETVSKRSSELNRVAEEYGFDSVHELHFPSMYLDKIPLKILIDKISNVIDSIKPDTIIVPCKSDVHSDHRIAFEASYSCTKTFRYPYVKNVLMMEIISETDFTPANIEYNFNPNYFVEISDYIVRKIEIMEIYNDEIDENPFPRSIDHIKALAIHRGAFANMQYAESFSILKCIM